jgi:serine O-acetyltransferase
MFLDYIAQDSYRIAGKKISFINFLKSYRNQGFRYIFFLRLCSFYKKNILIYFISRVMLRHYVYKFGFQIPSNTKIGKGFYISHFGTIVINENASIGDYCNITHNVTIGQQNRGLKKGAPTIGNFVWIGTGSVIVGKISIGDNVLIAPNTYVNFDVPSHSIVIGNPAKIILRNNPTENYINRIPQFN